METIYIPKHFVIQEFVPPDVYADRGEKAWELLDQRMLITQDQLREVFGPMIVNNWHMNNRPSWAPNLRSWAGLRTEDSPWGTRYSQHRFGRATDSILRDITAEEARQYILAHQNEFPFIGSIELGTSWLHYDVRNCDRIKTYTP